jgi:hypothetical protein
MKITYTYQLSTKEFTTLQVYKVLQDAMLTQMQVLLDRRLAISRRVRTPEEEAEYQMLQQQSHILRKLIACRPQELGHEKAST